MSTNNFNEVKEEVKNDLKKVKSVDDAFKLQWYYPAITALLLLLLTTILSQLAGWFVGLGLLASIGVGIFQSQGKPSPVKMDWYWILLPTIALGVLLAVPSFTGWIIFGLILWAGIAAMIKYKPFIKEDTDNKE